MNRASEVAAAVLVVLLATVTFSCQGRARVSHANVILIVIDTLRADHLGNYGYSKPTSPKLDELAARATRFANARSTSSWTLPSVSSMMTGLYPAVHGAEKVDSVLSGDLDTMAQYFHDAGYETAAFSANPAFVTPRQGLGRGFDSFDVLHGSVADKDALDAVPADASLLSFVHEASAEDLSSAALKWLGERKSPAPFFLYLHYFDPHAAYKPPPEFARRFGVDPAAPLAGEAQWPYLLASAAPPPDVLSVLVALYDAEIAATDAAIGRLLAGIASPLLESTIVVVTSDHGEEFGDHGGVQHGRTLYDELIRVPLLMAGPGIPAGKVAETPVSLANLWATLAELTGTPLPSARIVEPSFAPSMSHEPETGEPIYADLDARYQIDPQHHRRALIDGAWKLLVDPQGGTELFDLSQDRSEQRSIPRDPDRLGRMRSDLRDRDAMAVMRREAAPPRQVILDPAKREQLKALGYLQ